MATPSPEPAAEAAFRRLADEIVDSYCAFYPGSAVEMGLHEYDGQVGDFSRRIVRERGPGLNRPARRGPGGCVPPRAPSARSRPSSR